MGNAVEQTGPKEQASITFLRNPEGKIWLAERTAKDRVFCGLWAAPGGGVEEDEDPLQAAVREVKEETGLSLNGSRFFGGEVTSGSKTERLHWFLVDLTNKEVPQCVEPTKQGPWKLFDTKTLPELPPDSEWALTMLASKMIISRSKYAKGPFKADFMGGYVFSGPEHFMFAQVRGWGQLQYGKDGAAMQDAHLQFMVDALNEKASGALSKALGGLKKANEEIAELSHPEFGDIGRLQEEIHELKKENAALKEKVNGR